MLTIFKYQIPLNSHFILKLPVGAICLSAQEQDGVPYLWALVNPNAATERRLFSLFGTGHTIDTPPGRHIGTFQMNGGQFVWHLFETQTK